SRLCALETYWPVLEKPDHEIRHINLVTQKGLALGCPGTFQIGNSKNLFHTAHGSFWRGLPETQSILLLLIIKVASSRVRNKYPRGSENSGLRSHGGSFADVEG